MLRGRRIHLSWAGSMMSTGSASTTWPGIPLTPSRVAWSLRWVPFTFCQLKLISSDGGKHWRVRWACDLRTWIHWPKGAHPILHQGYKHGLWAQQWHHSDRRVGQVIITYYLKLWCTNTDPCKSFALNAVLHPVRLTEGLPGPMQIKMIIVIELWKVSRWSEKEVV